MPTIRPKPWLFLLTAILLSAPGLALAETDGTTAAPAEIAPTETAPHQTPDCAPEASNEPFSFEEGSALKVRTLSCESYEIPISACYCYAGAGEWCNGACVDKTGCEYVCGINAKCYSSNSTCGYNDACCQCLGFDPI